MVILTELFLSHWNGIYNTTTPWALELTENQLLHPSPTHAIIDTTGNLIHLGNSSREAEGLAR
jgi:hypothetical protein